MPPSPSLRRSPKRDNHGDSHKRGSSLESGISFREKEDDLALFNEMQSIEKESFLLDSTDDFEDLLSSKKKPFPDIKLGISITARGESSDLLNADDDKNDYEWLITPPDTPLFRSLDDEPGPVNLLHSDRARSRPLSLSRSSTMNRSQRGSPSPQQLSPSPRSGTSTFRGRPSSAPQSNPGLHPSTPSRRFSPPPIKASTPPSRSLTPTSRRTTGSPGSPALPGTRGVSPVRTSRGNSASPKIRAWQSNIPGFSLEAPPNLRTSLADRPASYVRGSSPASRSSKDSSSKFGRQSMSPTPSRSISSSHSQERDRLSSHSRASLASSGDDDADSLQSVPVSVSDRYSSRKVVSGYSSRPSVYSKRPMKTFSPSSAPKRSFDSAMRQMDRKSPQNMFRPLLSSVPSSTFYSGKASPNPRTMISRNSSITTSSNTSSDVATSGAHDTEGSDQYQDDMVSDCARAVLPDIHDEVCSFDKMDIGSEDTGQEQVNSSVAQIDVPDEGSAFVSYPGDTGESHCHNTSTDTVTVNGALEVLNRKALVCSVCGSCYHPDNLDENEDDICFECKRLKLLTNSALLSRLETTQCASVPLVDSSVEPNVTQNLLDVPQLKNAMGDTQSSDVLEMDLHQVDTAETQHHACRPVQSGMDNMDYTGLNVGVAEGTGISVLLNRSTSIKAPIVHGRTIHSSVISFEDLSYARDLTSSMRSSSVGHGSVSTSSSIDLTSARHAERAVRRQLNGKLSDSRSKPLGTVYSPSGTSVAIVQAYGLSTSSHEGSIEESIGNIWHSVAVERPASHSDQVVALENTEVNLVVPSDGGTLVTEADINGIFSGSRVKDPAHVAEDMLNIEAEDKSRASVGIDASNSIPDFDGNRQKIITDIENVESASLAEESTVSSSRSCQEEVSDNLPQCASSIMSEIEINDSHPSSPRSQTDVVPKEDLEDPSADSTKEVKDNSVKSGESDSVVGIVEESTVTVEDRGERRTRSLTLEEATDTILFCSSIIHDLAYKAASIAAEKEKENLEPLEGLRPTVTIPDKKDSRGNATNWTPKTRVRKKHASKAEAKPPPTQTDERPNAPVVRSVGLPVDSDSMKSPKLEAKCNCTIM